jgi:hypothetical protein
MLVLIQVQEEMRNGQVALEKYVITKTLTKPPEAYPDAKNQPHVLVSTNYFLFSFTLNSLVCVFLCSDLLNSEDSFVDQHTGGTKIEATRLHLWLLCW